MMTSTYRTPLILITACTMIAGCSSTSDLAHQRDDVYFSPQDIPMDKEVTTRPEPRAAAASDDYYDPQESIAAQRSYYDMTYGDPYFYNYGRFGWNRPPMGMGSGFYGGTSMFYGDPWYGGGYNLYGGPMMGSYPGNSWGWSLGMGYGNYYDPYGMYPGYGWSPYGYGAPFYGYGFPGSYWCPPSVGYFPMSTFYYGHRSSLGGNGTGNEQTTFQGRRSPYSLMPQNGNMQQGDGARQQRPALIPSGSSNGGNARPAPSQRPTQTTTPSRPSRSSDGIGGGSRGGSITSPSAPRGRGR